jgi:hypothetical protein
VTGTIAAVAVAGTTVPTIVGEGEAVEAPAQVPLDDGETDRLLQRSVEAERLTVSLEPPLREASTVRPRIYDDGCFVGWGDTTSPACEYGDPDGDRTVVLFGDSHAAHWAPALDDLATDRGWRLVVLGKPSCPSLDVEVTRRGDPYPACPTWRRDSVRRIAAEEADVVVLANARVYQPLDDDGTSPVTNLVEGTTRTAAAIRAASPSTRIVVIGPTPQPSVDVPVCLSEHLDDIGSCARDADRALDAELMEAERAALGRAGIELVEVAGLMCTSGVCPAVIGDRLVYADRQHLTVAFARWLVPRLEQELVPIVEGPSGRRG